MSQGFCEQFFIFLKYKKIQQSENITDKMSKKIKRKQSKGQEKKTKRERETSGDPHPLIAGHEKSYFNKRDTKKK